MDGYIVAGPLSTFRFQPNDSRTVRFPAIFALRVDFVRSVRVDVQDSQLRRTHESAVKASSTTPTAPAAPSLNCLCAALSSRSRRWMSLLDPRSPNAAKLTVVPRIVFQQGNPQKSRPQWLYRPSPPAE